MKIVLILIMASLTGCSTVKQSANSAIVGDGVTTVAGVASGLAVEANPLITSPAALAASVALRLTVVNHIDQMPEPQRTNGLAAVSAANWGIAASNLGVLAIGSNPIGFLVGAIVGYSVWKNSESEREFAALCAYSIQEGWATKCDFKQSQETPVLN